MSSYIHRKRTKPRWHRTGESILQLRNLFFHVFGKDVSNANTNFLFIPRVCKSSLRVFFHSPLLSGLCEIGFHFDHTYKLKSLFDNREGLLGKISCAYWALPFFTLVIYIMEWGLKGVKLFCFCTVLVQFIVIVIKELVWLLLHETHVLEWKHTVNQI